MFFTQIYLLSRSSGMAQNPSTSSTQNSINVYVNGTANSLLTIKAESGEEIISFAPSKSYQSVIISSPELETGKTYSAYYGGTSTGTSTDGLYTDGTTSGGTEITSFTLSSTVSNVSQSGVTTGGSNSAMPGAGGNMTKPNSGRR